MSQSSDTSGLDDWIFIDKFYTDLLRGKSYFGRTAKLNGGNECIYHFHGYKMKRNWNHVFVSRNDLEKFLMEHMISEKRLLLWKVDHRFGERNPVLIKRTFFFPLEKILKSLCFFLPEWKPKQNRHAILQSCQIRDTCPFPHLILKHNLVNFAMLYYFW